jgi:hypothetical protein
LSSMTNSRKTDCQSLNNSHGLLHFYRYNGHA